MAEQMQTRRTRQATPARWQKAARRAVDEGIEVRQVNENGMWVANSGTQANVAYLLEIAQSVVRSCSCPAGQFGDPCCKHAAKWYLDAGVLELDDPEPEPPAPAVGVEMCWACAGVGLVGARPCLVCHGAGAAPLVAQAAALVTAAAIDAEVELCGECSGPAGDDAVRDDALGIVCGACAEAGREAALAAWLNAVAAAHEQAVYERTLLAA
jgi:hypothetical protein